VYSFIDRLSRLFALLGGLVLTALIVLTCISIVGRLANGVLHGDWIESLAPEFTNYLLELGVGPVNGDFELVETGMAFAIFAFLPICQLKSAHASVDIFTAALPLRINRLLRAVIEVVFASVLVLIAWQLFAGTLSKYNSGQTTFLLEFPVWWAYALSLLAAIAAALTAVYVAVVRCAEAASGCAILPDDSGVAP